MGVNAQHIYSGGPNQGAVGAILRAGLGVVAPTADDIFGSGPIAGWDDGGFVSDDGLTLNVSKSFEEEKDWAGIVVKRILSEFSASASYQHMEVGEFSLKDAFGDGEVDIDEATAEAGTRYKVTLGAKDLPARQYLFRMKDGDQRSALYVPAGVVTELEEI